MSKHLLTAIFASVISLSVQAAKPGDSSYVGYASLFISAQDVFKVVTLNQACKALFGPTSKLATTEEYYRAIEEGSLDGNPPLQAITRAVLVGGGFDSISGLRAEGGLVCFVSRWSECRSDTAAIVACADY